MKPYSLLISRTNKNDEGVTFTAVLTTIEKEVPPVAVPKPLAEGAYIAGPVLTQSIHLTNKEVRQFQKKDKSIDYDLIETHCWVKLLQQMANGIYKQFLHGNLEIS